MFVQPQYIAVLKIFDHPINKHILAPQKGLFMLKLAFCETDPEIFTEISVLLKKYETTESLHVKGFLNPSEYIQYVDYHGFELDILLCNIIMDNYNGIKLMHTVQKSLPNIQIIFASQYKELVFDAYAVRHVAFIPVPIASRHFHTAMRMAIANAQESKNRNYLTLTSRGLLTRLDIANILYLESNLRILHVYTIENHLEFPRQLETVKPLLDARFVHCHKSYIVNMDYVTKFDISSMCFVLTNNHTVPISSRKAAQTRSIFESYVSQ